MADETEYWDGVRSLDRGSCRRMADGLIAEGRGRELVSLIADAQRRVGLAWESADFSIAEEHAATAINDAMLGMLEAHETPAGDQGAIAVLCVEDEWHSMPARLLATTLRLEGWDVVFFGASLPVDDAGSIARVGALRGIAVSCTMPTNLFRVRELAEAMAGVSAPILGGGIGFGPEGKWARAAGVDAYAVTALDASTRLQSWQPGVDVCRGPLDPAEGPWLNEQRADRIAAVMATLRDRVPAMAAYDQRQLRHSEADVGHILDYLDTAALTGDDELFLVFAEWLQRVLTSRGVPAGVLPVSLECVSDAVSDQADAVRRLDLAIDRLSVA